MVENYKNNEEKFSFFFQQNMTLTIEPENISSYFGNAAARFK